MLFFTDDDDATDADEITFDGSTISLSLSPLMTPAKHGNCFWVLLYFIICFYFCLIFFAALSVAILMHIPLHWLGFISWQTQFLMEKTTRKSWRRIWASRYPSWAWVPRKRWKSPSHQGRIRPMRFQPSPRRKRKLSFAHLHSWKRARRRRMRKKTLKPEGVN